MHFLRLIHNIPLLRSWDDMNGLLSSKCRALRIHFKLICPSDPFNITYPTAVQTSLDAHALVAKFDPSGRFVATGILNGAAQVWDLDTKAAIRTPDGHVKAVTSLECVDAP